MNYDPQHSAAVFLGPSLPRHQAQRLFPANYYPPAALGDVYRLLGTGVRQIVLIDGVFHGRTPVWQRELLSAIESGIEVMGSTSMGALRAAELDRLGMIGHGRIYEWYRDGALDGDDEVALEHADEWMDWQALSEPLVNVRYALSLAEREGVLTLPQSNALIAHLKGMHFAIRTYPRMLQACDSAGLSPSQSDALADFLADHPSNLKRDDARDVLRWCAARRQQAAAPPAPVLDLRLPRATVPTAYPPFATLMRGLWRDDGELVPVRSAWEPLAADASRVAPLIQSAAGRFYLQQALEALGVPGPTADDQAAARDRLSQRAGSDPVVWLRRVGLTESEFIELEARQAWCDRQLARPLHEFGLAFEEREAALQSLALWYGKGLPPDQFQGLLASLRQRAHTGALVAEWARGDGIEMPSDVLVAFTAGWLRREGFTGLDAACEAMSLSPAAFASTWAEQAQLQWMMEQTPVYFGYETWSAAHEVMRAAQCSGEILQWLPKAGAKP